VNEGTELFKNWMDEHRLRAADVCGALQVSERTVHQWRSLGVPPRRFPHVKKLMEEWKFPVHPPGKEDVERLRHHKLTVFADQSQMDRWTIAFKNSSAKTLSQWMEEGLDRLAKEYEQNHPPKNPPF